MTSTTRMSTWPRALWALLAIPAAGFALSADPGKYVWEDLNPVAFGGNEKIWKVLPVGDSIFVGGGFTKIGDVPAKGVALWTGSEWKALGDGLEGDVYSLAWDDQGGLVAMGAFIKSGSSTVGSCARWNGTVWSPYLSGLVDDLVKGKNGAFYGIKGQGSGKTTVHQWDGSGWRQVGESFTGNVNGIALDSSAGIVACGNFSKNGSDSVAKVARWDGQKWSQLGEAVPDGNVSDVQVAPDGRVWIVGDFLKTGTKTTNGIAWWNGTQWDSVASEGSSSIRPWLLAFGPAGDVYAYSSYSESIYHWKDFKLSEKLDPPTTSLATIAFDHNGNLVLAGEKNTLGAVDRPNLYRWNGYAFEMIENKGINGAVNRMIRMDDGSMVLGGEFTSVYGVKARRVVRKTGDAWSPLGDGLNGSVQHLAKDSGGRIYASGTFLLDSSHLAVWNGTTWKGIPGVIGDGPILAGADGRLVACTRFLSEKTGTANASIAVWNDTGWSTHHPAIKSIGYPQAIGLDSKGRVVLGQRRQVPPYTTEIWRDEDTGWKLIGGFQGTNPEITTIRALPDGRLLVAGELNLGMYSTFDGIAVFDTTWHSLRDSMKGSRTSNGVSDVDIAPDGTIWIAGPIGQQDAMVAVYDGKNWHGVGTNDRSIQEENLLVKAILLDENGLPYIGGDFRATPYSATSFFSHLAQPGTGVANRVGAKEASFLTGAGAAARIAKAGKLEIMDARGRSLWSGAVEVGFRPSQAAPGAGLRLLRMGRETLLVLF